MPEGGPPNNDNEPKVGTGKKEGFKVKNILSDISDLKKEIPDSKFENKGFKNKKALLNDEIEGLKRDLDKILKNYNDNLTGK